MVCYQVTHSTCSICGMEEENTFHALILCPKAVALRMALRDIRVLPAEEVLTYTGTNWFLVLLNQLCPTMMRDQIIFVFWRAGHLKNDFIVGKGKESNSASASFVDNYWTSFVAWHALTPMDPKNKMSDWWV